MLTQERVRELFDYREDGALVRRVWVNSSSKVGAVAGSRRNNGYVATRVDGVERLNHRLVWLWHHGYLPEHGLDHIDRVRSNNSIENLREVTPTCNMRNTGLRCDNISGVKGVSWHKGMRRWQAAIAVGGVQTYLGAHSSFLEAVCHRLAAEQALDWAGCDSASPAFQYVKKHIRPACNI